MYDSTTVIRFRRLQDELRRNCYFLDILNNQNFIVGDSRYINKWQSMMDSQDPRCETKMGVFQSLDEVRAFALGLTLGKNKKWKID
ncbi:hypothetical protein LCGC14_0142580 [marine sediment metagenome]|uniref:Uncharacterized protein n=1 Tax=marine sediment metagenome TaxID=412755 RepID=A0A0F9Y2V7_9ZZZZ